VGRRVRRRPLRQTAAGRKPKNGDPRGASASLGPTPEALVASIERVEYDAERVGVEVRRAGLPAEYADKLPAAA
jgi:hypothetical protein